MIEEEGEVWKDINIEGNDDGKYQVSSWGRVYNQQGDCFVSPVLTGGPPYFYVNLQLKGGRVLRRVHNLMCRSFYGSPAKGMSTDHIDINPYNNSLDNLRWLDKVGQMKNRTNTVWWCEDTKVSLRDKLREDPRTKGEGEEVYSFIINYFKVGVDYETCLLYHSYYNKYGKSWSIKIPCQYKHHPSGEYLVTVALQEGWDFLDSKRKLVTAGGSGAWTLEEIAVGWRVITFPLSLESDNMWFPNKVDFYNYVKGCGKYTYAQRALVQGHTPQEILDKDYDILDTYRFTLRGYYGTQKEHCIHQGVKAEALYDRMSKHGMSFEEALFKPTQRVVKYSINGVVWKAREVYQLFGLDARVANSRKSKKKWTLEQTLQSYGVDTSKIEITPLGMFQ